MKMEDIFENVMVDNWVRNFLRNPLQVNKPHETDAELIGVPGDSNNYLAVTIDTVAEEITTGLYQDPYTMGWVTVMACVSDLAAVGAYPLGLIISVSLEPERDEEFTNGIAKGMGEACRKLGIFILGGDTNITPTISLTACALGLVPVNEVITRCGCKVGDEVYMTGGGGIGNALGFARITQLKEGATLENLYRPVARIQKGQIIREFANCSMDTSDGLLSTLDQLMRLNGLGFEINCDWENILAPEVFEFCIKTETPPWLMLAGPHGEFELVFTVAGESMDIIHNNPFFNNSKPIKLGKVQQKPAITLKQQNDKFTDIDVATLRNLLQNVGGDLHRYVQEFLDFGKRHGLEKLPLIQQ